MRPYDLSSCSIEPSLSASSARVGRVVAVGCLGLDERALVVRLFLWRGFVVVVVIIINGCCRGGRGPLTIVVVLLLLLFLLIVVVASSSSSSSPCIARYCSRVRPYDLRTFSIEPSLSASSALASTASSPSASSASMSVLVVGLVFGHRLSVVLVRVHSAALVRGALVLVLLVLVLLLLLLLLVIIFVVVLVVVAPLLLAPSRGTARA